MKTFILGLLTFIVFIVPGIVINEFFNNKKNTSNSVQFLDFVGASLIFWFCCVFILFIGWMTEQIMLMIQQFI